MAHSLVPIFDRLKVDLLRAKPGSCLYLCVRLYDLDKVFGLERVEHAKNFLRVQMGSATHSLETLVWEGKFQVPSNLNRELLSESVVREHRYMTAKQWDEWRKLRVMWINMLIAKLNTDVSKTWVWPAPKEKCEKIGTS